jgi:tetratricopeptide (TPR) repeat protein
MQTSAAPKSDADRALIAYRAGQFDEAARDFSLSADGYARLGDELHRAEMANNLAVALLALGRPGEAREAVTGTEAIFHRAGDLRRAAMAVGNLAAALEAEGEFSPAENSYRRAAFLFADCGDRESQAKTLQALSQLLLREGRPLEAVSAMEEGLEIHTGGVRGRVLRWLLRLPSRFLSR